jgi:hypothetical protein
LENGGSTKRLLRTILLSGVYQQSSIASAEATARDPENRLLARFSGRRLEAEAIRDSMLAVTGRLDPALGGRATLDPHQPRRSLYIQTVRYTQQHFAPLFDAADPTACVGRRNSTTVAPQALFLLNDPFVREQCRYLAARLTQGASAPETPELASARLTWAYQWLYARPPAEAERQIGLWHSWKRPGPGTQPLPGPN